MKIQFGIRIDERVLEAIKRQAECDCRTTSSLIVKILTDHVGEKLNARKAKEAKNVRKESKRK